MVKKKIVQIIKKYVKEKSSLFSPQILVLLPKGNHVSNFLYFFLENINTYNHIQHVYKLHAKYILFCTWHFSFTNISWRALTDNVAHSYSSIWLCQFYFFMLKLDYF